MGRVRLKQSARYLFIEIGEVFDVELGDEERASARMQPLARACQEGEEAVAARMQYTHLEQERELTRGDTLKAESCDNQVPDLMLIFRRCSERLKTAIVGGNFV
jgi:hypothetical protein